MATLILARNYTEARAYAVNDLGLKPGDFRIATGVDSIRAVRNSDLHLVPGWKRRHDKFAIQSALRWTRLNVIDVEAQLLEHADLTLGDIEAALEENDGKAPAFVVQVVGDDVEPPQYHKDMVARVLPSSGVDAEADHEARKAAHLADLEERGIIEPEGWEPPESLSSEQVLRLAAGESGADVAPVVDAGGEPDVSDLAVTPEPEAEVETEVKRTRRRRCKECGVLVEPDDVESHAASHESE